MFVVWKIKKKKNALFSCSRDSLWFFFSFLFFFLFFLLFFFFLLFLVRCTRPIRNSISLSNAQWFFPPHSSTTNERRPRRCETTKRKKIRRKKEKKKKRTSITKTLDNDCYWIAARFDFGGCFIVNRMRLRSKTTRICIRIPFSSAHSPPLFFFFFSL